jgi:hypothetical protein
MSGSEKLSKIPQACRVIKMRKKKNVIEYAT